MPAFPSNFKLLKNKVKFYFTMRWQSIKLSHLIQRFDIINKTAGVAQLVEHWIVAPVVAGSSPVARPIFLNNAPVVQLDRIPDFESVGRRFESCQARHIFLKVKKIMFNKVRRHSC